MGALLVLILLFGVMYAAMIRPQQKRAREHQALVAAVQVGDEVMTTAGIFGTVTDVEGDVISIEITPGVVMRVARAAIGRRMSADFDEYEGGETFDDADDELGTSGPDETSTMDNSASTNDGASANDGAANPTPTPEPPISSPPPVTLPEPPISAPPPVTPPSSETPPSPPGGPTEQG
jgi:preprotein translocase subunit YajC